jgi:4-hydroxybenzoate polyprenyltransferase
MTSIKRYLSLVKFSHTIFSLPFAVVGFFMGIAHVKQAPEPIVYVAVLLCLVFARNAAMGFNRWADRRYDLLNPRTQNREIPAKKISETSAIAFILINILLFITTTYFINDICFFLSPVALLIILIYSYTKRFSWLCHYVLGLSLMIAPIGAYMAISGILTFDIFLLGVAVMFWVAGFDIIYSLQDTGFDKNTGLHSIPSRFGEQKAIILSRFTHVLTFITMAIWWLLYHSESYFVLAAVISFSLLLFRQHFLVRLNKYEHINAAFFITNGIASIVFCVFYLMNLL